MFIVFDKNQTCRFIKIIQRIYSKINSDSQEITRKIEKM